jgi:hypothetical protein
MKYARPAEKNARLPWWLTEEGLVASFLGAIDGAKLVEALGLPVDNSIVPLAVIPLGYKASRESVGWNARHKAEARTRRRRFEEFEHWDRW